MTVGDSVTDITRPCKQSGLGPTQSVSKSYLPIELCSGDAKMLRDFSKLGIVCLKTRLEGDLKNALSHRLLAWLEARVVSETV